MLFRNEFKKKILMKISLWIFIEKWKRIEIVLFEWRKKTYARNELNKQQGKFD